MAKKKAIPVIRRSVGKDKRVRFFAEGTSRQISNKNNEAARAFVKQNFDRLVSSPSAQATLTPFEKQSLEQTRRARKGSAKLKESLSKAFRIKGRRVSKNVENLIKFNPLLQNIVRDPKDGTKFITELTKADPRFANLKNTEDAIDILNDIVQDPRERRTYEVVAVIENPDYKRRPEGFFRKPIELVNLLAETQSGKLAKPQRLRIQDKTKPPTTLLLIMPEGARFENEIAIRVLSNYITDITDDFMEQNSVVAFFKLPYFVQSVDGTNQVVVDLTSFDPEDEDFVEILGSEPLSILV
jgi:hypothetical protein